MRKPTPPQLLILSFICVIVIGTVLLSLPAATRGEARLSLVDSLFTATSATCVTGLTVRDTGRSFSQFGKWVIFAMFQMGGLGIMTFSTLFAVLLGRKIGFYESDVIKSTLDKNSILGLRKLIVSILCITIISEVVGAFCLFLRWHRITDWSFNKTLENAVFHSVSGFCNAGFSLFSDSLTQFKTDPYINLTMIFLIFLGGIGFVVIMDILGLFSKRRSVRGVSLQTKIALAVSFVLIAAGAILVFVFERTNVLQGMTLSGRIWSSVFQSVTARTAGFNTLPIDRLSVPLLVFMTFLMFVGASPGSTGGGIKTCSLAVIAATVTGMVKNKRRIMLFGRSISQRVVREALVIFFLALSWVFICTILLTYTEGRSFIRSLFEVVSAFGTVGLTTGITGNLTSAGKACIIATMFAGRVGPLTLALAIAFRERKDNYIFPEENIMVG